MTHRILSSGAALLALMLSAAYAQKEEPAKTYKDPKDVYAAATAAAKKEDYKAFYALLTPDSQALMAGQLAQLGMMLRGYSDFDKTDKTRNLAKPVIAAMDKHGLTPEVSRGMKLVNPKDKPDEQLKQIQAIIKPIKKRGEFVEDMMKGMSEMSGKKGGGLKDIADDELKDLKITGDKATAVAVGKRASKESKTDLKFEKIDGSWKIVLPQPKAKDGDD